MSNLIILWGNDRSALHHYIAANRAPRVYVEGDVTWALDEVENQFSFFIDTVILIAENLSDADFKRIASVGKHWTLDYHVFELTRLETMLRFQKEYKPNYPVNVEIVVHRSGR